MLTGSIDDAGRTRMRGWVRGGTAPDAPVCLLLPADDRLLERVVANRYRPDLEAAGIGNGRFGFDVVLRPPLDPTRGWVIHVRAEGSGEDMPGSPLRLDPSSDFDDAARAAFTAALLGFADDAEAERRHRFLLEQCELLLQARADRRGASWPSSGDEAEQAMPRALVIDAIMPDPDRDGGSVAILSHMRSLRRLGYRVTFAAQSMPGSGAASSALDRAGIGVCRRPEFGSVEEVLRRDAGRFDLAYLHRLPIASAYAPLVRHYQPRAHLVYGVADLHHLRLARQAVFENRPEARSAVRRVRDQELWAARSADAVVTHSSVEASLLRQVVPAERVHAIPWSIPCRPCAVPFARRHGIAFIGHYRHAPNIAAAYALRDTIMPRVRASDPSILCRLVGAGLPRSLQPPQHGLVVLGQVADLDAVFHAVRLTVAPLGFGAGLKAKVLQSFAAGIPCVCSRVAAEGLDLPADLQALVVADDDAMAEMILQLHRDQALNDLMSRRVADFARRVLSEDAIDAAMAEAVGGSGSVLRPVQGVPSTGLESDSRRSGPGEPGAEAVTGAAAGQGQPIRLKSGARRSKKAAKASRASGETS